MPQTPPRFVPTLTDVVPPSSVPSSVLESFSSTQPQDPSTLTDAAMLRIEKRVLRDVTDTVMRLLEATLEKQVREAVANVALAHAHTIAQDMLPAIEGVVTSTLETALRDALAKELADKSGYR
jgi:hypothetical protein